MRAHAGVDEFLDGSRAVLDASVGEQRWWRLGFSGLKEDGECVRRIEAFRDSPPEDLAGEVVDHGVEIGSRSIEKAHGTRVDVPNLVGT